MPSAISSPNLKQITTRDISYKFRSEQDAIIGINGSGVHYDALFLMREKEKNGFKIEDLGPTIITPIRKDSSSLYLGRFKMENDNEVLEGETPTDNIKNPNSCYGFLRGMDHYLGQNNMYLTSFEDVLDESSWERVRFSDSNMDRANYFIGNVQLSSGPALRYTSCLNGFLHKVVKP